MPESAVVLMTAFGSAEIVNGAIQLGAYRVVDKPFDMNDVDPMVRNAYQSMRIH
jgi:DNA-binding NtrC family response regulator